MGRIISHKYEELEQLGQGGQAVVYKVRHVDHRTILALKVLPSYLLENEEMVARFKREALLMARLRHSNIVRVLGSGHDEELSCHYIVMENIQGQTLKQYLRERGPLPLADVLEITRQVALALDYAHSQTPPVIHRDIKPSNIMIEDLTGRAVVLDFGIAKELDDGEGARTRTGLMIGTWKYSSPEQLRHETLSGSADVYSLGLVMYELFTGTQFFAGLDERAVLGKILYDPHEHEPYFARPVPQAFATLIRKAIAKNRDKRYRGMKDLLNDLEACWWTLDETSTRVVPQADNAPVQPEVGRDRIEEIEEQIRKLEHERHAHMVTLVQGQARDARLRAERVEARQLTPALFSQGISQEERGEAYLRDANFSSAQDAYHAALNAYEQASEEAASLMQRRQVEQARQEAVSAQGNAERYEASRRASEPYDRAVAFFEQAESSWQEESYEQAQRIYNEARLAFEDARDLAYRDLLKGEAEIERAQTRVKKELAISVGASELASLLLEEASTAERQADAALDDNELTQARALYHRASLKYEQAQQQASREHRRQSVAARAQQVDRARQHVTTLDQYETQPQYQQAVTSQQRANAYFAVGEYTRAEEAYAATEQLFTSVAQEVERERLRREANHARIDAEGTRAAAEQAGASHSFAPAWRAALDMLAAAQQLQQDRRYGEAAVEYRQVTQRFTQLREDATTLAQRMLADGCQQQMLAVKEQGSASRDWAVALWMEAQQAEARAQHAYDAQEYVQAAEGFRQAHLVYGQAKDHAEQEQRTAVTAAAEATIRQHEQAVTSGVRDDDPVYRQAVETHQQGDTALSEQNYRVAVEKYERAQALYTQAMRIVAQEQQRLDVARASQCMRTAQEEAISHGAERYFVSAWMEAQALVERAQRSEAQDDWTQATALYQQATQRFETLRADAAVRTLRAQAEESQREMQIAKAQGTTFQELVPALWQEAEALEHKARQSFAEHDYSRAGGAFNQATQSYKHATAIAQEELRQREALRHAAAVAYRHAEQARDAARAARQAEEAGDSFTYARDVHRHACSLFDQAESLWKQQSYDEAGKAYADAQQTFLNARDIAITERLRKEAVEAKTAGNVAREVAVQEEAAKLVPRVFAQAETQREYADSAYEKSEWVSARQLYEEARQHYVDAGEQAQAKKLRQRQKAMALAERDRASLALTATVTTNIDTHPLSMQGRQVFDHAQSLFAAEDYENAAQEYQHAYQLCEEATRVVAREQQDQALVHAREKMAATQASAQHAEAARHFSEEWSTVQQEIHAAQQAEKREAFSEATTLYIHITERLAQLEVKAAAAKAQEKEVEAVRAEFQAAQVAHSSLRQWAKNLWAEVKESEVRAERACQEKNYHHAKTLYQQALALVARATTEAEQEQQRERLRKNAFADAEHMQSARDRAIAAGATGKLQPPFAQAQEMERQATAHFAVHEYESASEAYRNARELYEEAIRQVETARQRQTMLRARQEAESTLQSATQVDIARRATEGWQAAQQKFQDAQQQEQQEEFRLATGLYQQAATAFAQLRLEAEQLLAQQELTHQQRVQRIFQQTEQSQREAEQAGVRQHVPQEYATAVRQIEEGKHAFTDKKWETAESLFLQAQAIFAEAIQRAQRHKLRAQAEVARTQAQALYAEAQQNRAAELFPEKGAAVASSLSRAEEAWDNQDFAAAHAAFETTARLLQQLNADVLRQSQRSTAEHAKAQALALQQQCKTTAGTLPRQAMQALANGDRAFQQGEYQGAGAQYEKALSLWASVRREETLQKETKPISPPAVVTKSSHAPEKELVVGSHYIRYSLLAAILIGLLAGVYRIVWFPHVDVLVNQGQGKSGNDHEPPPPAELAITSVTPDPSKTVSVKEGKHQKFTVAVGNAGKKPLRFVWQLNGKEQDVSGNEWLYEAKVDENEEKTGTIEVTVTDSDNQTVTQKWPISIQHVNRRPQIKSTTPRPGSLQLAANGTQRFAVEPVDPDRDDRIAIAWFLDGQKVASDSQWQMQASTLSGAHQVKVEVTDLGGLKAQLDWNVTIQSASIPLVLAQATPDPARTLTVAEGQPLPFAVVVEGGEKGKRQYAWRLDGKPQRANGEKWTYLPGFEDGGSPPKTVEVIISDSTLRNVQQRWNVEVRNVNRPPQIIKSSPRLSTLEMAANETQDFTVEGVDPDRDERLTYAWLLDGQEIVRDKRWQFHAPTTPGPHKIEAEVSDLGGLKKRQVWDVIVKAFIPPSQPPIWRLADPQEGRLRVQAGHPLEFAVAAEVTGGGQDEKSGLRYRWTVNGEVQSEEEGRFRLVDLSEPGMYQITVVAISAKGLQSGAKRWTVEVRSLERPVMALSEAEVRAWLEMYRRAFEEKDMNKLVSLGTHTQTQAEALGKVLRTYASYRVALVDVSIHCEGAQASLTFKRQDTMEGLTKDTDPITFSLEKSTNGRIAVVRR